MHVFNQIKLHIIAINECFSNDIFKDKYLVVSKANGEGNKRYLNYDYAIMIMIMIYEL